MGNSFLSFVYSSLLTLYTGQILVPHPTNLYDTVLLLEKGIKKSSEPNYTSFYQSANDGLFFKDAVFASFDGKSYYCDVKFRHHIRTIDPKHAKAVYKKMEEIHRLQNSR